MVVLQELEAQAVAVLVEQAELVLRVQLTQVAVEVVDTTDTLMELLVEQVVQE
tara:strand:+ start:255 stop:413 length:159 start_codon:yes stop_codon:yes gene_type:complete